jgi:hypothetical protein
MFSYEERKDRKSMRQKCFSFFLPSRSFSFPQIVPYTRPNIKLNQKNKNAEKICLCDDKFGVGQQHDVASSRDNVVESRLDDPESILEFLRLFPLGDVLHLLRVRNAESGHRSKRSARNTPSSPSNPGKHFINIFTSFKWCLHTTLLYNSTFVLRTKTA